jgi:hypothetical protein
MIDTITSSGTASVPVVETSGTIASSGTNVPKENPPKKNCRKCQGRGYVGVDATTKERIKCSCTWDDDTRRAFNYQQTMAQRFARK